MEGCAMGQVLHGSATTTEAIRRAIHHSQESLRALARRYGINQKTVAKWKNHRWARQGVWRRLFERVANAGSIPDELAIDSTHIKAHRSAGGGKKGKQRRRSVARAAGARARSTLWLTLSAARSPSS